MKPHFVRLYLICNVRDLTLLSSPLSNHKILHWSEYKGFADDILILTQMVNYAGKGNNDGKRYFLFFSQCLCLIVNSKSRRKSCGIEGLYFILQAVKKIIKKCNKLIKKKNIKTFSVVPM